MPKRPVSLQSGDSAHDRPEPRLLRAVEADNVVKVREVLDDAKSHRNLQQLLSIGLVRACDKAFVDVARFLLTRGADANYPCKDPSQPTSKPPGLLRAAEYGLTAIAEVLIDHGAHLEAKNKKGRTALMTAAYKGNFDVVKLLIAKGAHVDTEDLKRRNALHNLAADTGYEKSSASAGHKPKRRWGVDIVQYLLQAGINLDAEDNLGRTALHWACVTDNEELMKILLTTRFGGASPLARVNATETRMKTSLHFAAIHNRPQLAKLLLEHGADIRARSDGGWTALHSACQSASRSLVQILINANADVNCELLNGRTPLHAAAESGNVEAAECLLEQSGIKRAVKDRFGDTPLLMAAQKSNRAIAEMLAPWNHIYDLSPDEIEAAKKFDATIVDFGNFKNENKVMRRSVFELLYARDVRDSSKHAISTMPKNIKHTDFRWIHLPVNNIAWCDALLTKRFIEEGATDIEGYKALETSFHHQHKGQRHHSRFMRPMCQVVQRTAPDVDDSDTPAVIVEEPERLSPIPGTPTKGPEAKPNTSQAEKQGEAQAVAGAEAPSTPKPKSKPGKPQRQTTQDTSSTLAAPETSSAATSKPPKQKIQRQETSSTVATSESNTTKKGSKAKVKDHRKPNPRQQSRSSLDKSPSGKRSLSACNIFMFMPYLHFETDRRRREMQSAMENPERLQAQPMAAVADEVLIRAHLTKSASFLHVRRTLDQFFYHNIDTSIRDCDQVVYRFQTKGRQDPDPDAKIFMVDQLWVWILGKDLVITSFPQRWRQPRNDSLNVLEGIIEDINSKTRDPVTSVYELAMTIAGRCFGTFDRHRKGDDEFQFLDMFEASIGAAMDNEAKLFQDFSKASRQASEWLQTHQRTSRFSRNLEAQSKAYEHAVKKHPDRLTYDDLGDREPQFIDQLLDVGAETDLLAEIKDIRDELDIIRMVLGHQEHLLPELRDAIKGVYHAERSHVQVRKVDKVFDEQEKTIGNPVKDLERMEKQANRVYESINNLLDLKQKHANAFEARFARDQAAGTQRQGQTLMVFTVVTVIFLPLSFIAAFFAINIEQFPHPPQANGQQEMSLSYVSGYVFGIGLAISVPCIAVAVSIDEINHFVIEAKRRLRSRWLKWKRNRDPDAQHDLDIMRIEQTLSMAKTMRRSMDVNWKGKPMSPPPRLSVESRWNSGNGYRQPSRPELDLERGRRNARTDTFAKY